MQTGDTKSTTPTLKQEKRAGVIPERNKTEYDQPTHPGVIVHITKLLTALEDQ